MLLGNMLCLTHKISDRLMSTGTPPENSVRIRVFTITISAPQDVHRMGARSFTQAIERPGSNFMSLSILKYPPSVLTG